MKKLILLFALMYMASCVSAQNTPVTMSGTATLTNADTVEVTQTVEGVYKTISIQAVVTKYSGTVAGFAIIKGSVDGINYVNINTDSLTLANQTTNTKVWVLEGSMYKYYKIMIVTTGTSSAQGKGYLFGTGQGGSKHSVSNMLSALGATTTTVTNTATSYVELQVKGSYDNVVIQAVSNKISGTAAGTITLQGSNDGTNYVTVDNSYSVDMSTSAPYTTGGAVTLTVTDVATSTKIFVINGSPYAYYRLSHTGSGTMASQLKGYLMPNK